MGRIKGLRHSPVLLVAAVAMVAAVAGTAVANDPGASTSALNKKSVKKIAKKELAKQAPDLTVGNSELLDNQDSSAFLGSDLVTRFGQTTLPDGTPFKSVVAKCQSGEKIIGGGANALVSGESVYISGSRPADTSKPDPSIPDQGGTFDAWRAFATNESGGVGDTFLRAWAVCAS